LCPGVSFSSSPLCICPPSQTLMLDSI
jgi:hypothetical protein